MKIALLLIGLCWVSVSEAQSSYRNGYIITTKSDTVNGYIRYGQKGNVSAPCYFKSNSKDSAKAYAPRTILGFRFKEDRYFVSRSIGKSEDVFLELLVEGKMRLYKFGKVYFIEKGNNTFFELSDGMEVSVVEGEQLKTKSKNFTRMLYILMTDCVETSKKVSTVKLKEKHLMRIVSSYNTCMGSSNKYYRRRVHSVNLANYQ